MELWIRSQNKRELRPNPKLGLDKLENEYYIVDRYDFESSIILGKYKEEIRALEVLNEIENLLIPKYLIRIDGNTQKVADFLNTGNEYIKAEGNGDIKNINNTVVYKMPEK